MKLGVNTLVWLLSFTENDFDLFGKIRVMGFNTIEITPGAEFKKIDPEKLRNKLDGTGLGVSLCGALDDIGYRGYGVIESFAQGKVAAFANIWRPLVDNQDDIPSKGLQFLRRKLG